LNYQQVIRQQRDFFNTNQTRRIDFRIQQLKKLKSVLRSHESALIDAIYKDFRKSKFEALTNELALVYMAIDESIRNLPRWAKQRKVKTNLINFPAKSYLIPEPLGVCLVIGAWNYPYQLTLIPLVNAIAAGNTVVLKPSEIASCTSAALSKMIHENFPPGYLIVTEGGVGETTELLNQKFDKIFFTGSTTVGKIVYQAAAKNLTPVTLEMGGKSPVIVTVKCKLQVAARRIVWGKFLNAGQSCICPDYVLADEKIKDELLHHLKNYIDQFEYSFENDNYVQIINDRNFNRLIALIDKSKLFYGGESDPQTRFIAPTILTGITMEDDVMKGEIFGPILPVLSYRDLDEAVQIIKSGSKPLACYIFTDDREIRDILLSELSFGGGAVNDTMMQLSNSHLPFGGVGESGLGGYHGETGFNTFSHLKSIIEKKWRFETNLKYSPYTARKLSWLKRLLSW
jgi:aldehyde dehydrogenase (NAD+)